MPARAFIALVVAAFGFFPACGSSSTGPSANIVGNWSGTNSLGGSFQFVVESNMTIANVGYNVTCTPSGGQPVTYSNGFPMDLVTAGNAYAQGGNWVFGIELVNGLASNAAPVFGLRAYEQINGQFSDSSDASGTWTYIQNGTNEAPPASGCAAAFNWTVRKSAS